MAKETKEYEEICPGQSKELPKKIPPEAAPKPKEEDKNK